MNYRLTTILTVLTLCLFISAGCDATENKSDKATIGQEAPGFSGLVGVDDHKQGLSDFKEAKAVVVIFTCNHCPVAKAYEDRIIAIAEDYKDKGVQVVAINSNSPKKQPQDSLEKMKLRAAAKDLGDWRSDKKAFNFPYLVDATQEVARAYGATCTPHVFLLDKNRKIVYTGAIDDNIAAKKVKEHYLCDALDAVLADKKPPKSVTKQFGCGIKWEKPKK
ncbi:MAG: thioredoxin family protein [Pirellulales bacterium]|nr:thioredoxin family protein [Pirellulales bacterium]